MLVNIHEAKLLQLITA